MIIFTSLFALTVGVALSHALVYPYKGKPVPPYEGKFFCDDSHWLESPPCCKVSAEFHDECEPCITDYPSAKPCRGNAKPGLTTRMTDYEFVGKPSEMEPFDPCFRRHGGLIPACCILSEEGRFVKSKKRWEDCVRAEKAERVVGRVEPSKDLGSS